MGLNSGEVVVGKIGDDLRMDYTAQGHTVGLAQRMESLAEPNKRLSERRHREARGGLLRPRGSRRLPGEGGVRARGGLRTRAAPGPCETASTCQARARGLSRFVGRATRWKTLERGARAGAARARGRSSAWPATRALARAASASSSSSGAGHRGSGDRRPRRLRTARTSPSPHAPALARLLRDHERDDECGAAREDRRAAAASRPENFDAFLPVLFEFLGVPDPDRLRRAHRARRQAAADLRGDPEGRAGRRAARWGRASP